MTTDFLCLYIAVLPFVTNLDDLRPPVVILSGHRIRSPPRTASNCPELSVTLGQLFTNSMSKLHAIELVQLYNVRAMIAWARANSSHRTGLVVLALLAVLVPAMLFSIVQYRSLADLESKTRVAVQDNLRQTLEGVSRETTKRLEAIAADSLNPIEASAAEQEKLSDIELRLITIKQNSI